MQDAKFAISLPRILRAKEETFLQNIFSKAGSLGIAEFLCPSMDTLGFCLANGIRPSQITADASLYHWNTDSMALLADAVQKLCLPLELNSQELRTLCRAAVQKGCNTQNFEAVVYGRAPLMVTANCIKLTEGRCDHDRSKLTQLTDRKNVTFPVYTNCTNCYNIIYNSLPGSLLDALWMLWQDGIRHFRLDFTTESGAETETVLQTFCKTDASHKQQGAAGKLPFATTGGHFRRGVE